jgi:hypothetical protein
VGRRALTPVSWTKADEVKIMWTDQDADEYMWGGGKPGKPWGMTPRREGQRQCWANCAIC